MRPGKQQGVALITAVLIVAFASTVAAAMLVRQNIAVHRTANLVQLDLAWWYVVGLEEWAATLLDRDQEDNKIDHLGELWAQPVDFIPVDEGALSGRLEDWQGRFNLRSLIDAQGQAVAERRQQLIRLFKAVEELPPGRAEELASAIIDWMDSDSEPGFPGGAEDGIYLSRTPPYRSANLPMASLSELLLVEGVDRKVYAAIKPLLSLRPDGHAVNINTAPAAVLMSLSDKMTPAMVEGIIAKRTETPYESPAAFVGDSLLADSEVITDDITTSSQYFLAQGTALIGQVRLDFVSLLERGQGGKTRALAHSRHGL